MSDGGDRGRSTIKNAVRRAKCTCYIGATAPISTRITSRTHTSVTRVTQGSDGRHYAARQGKCSGWLRVFAELECGMIRERVMAKWCGSETTKP